MLTDDQREKVLQIDVPPVDYNKIKYTIIYGKIYQSIVTFLLLAMFAITTYFIIWKHNKYGEQPLWLTILLYAFIIPMLALYLGLGYFILISMYNPLPMWRNNESFDFNIRRKYYYDYTLDHVFK